MAATYDKIATTTLGSAQTTVTFSSITGSYTDLILIIYTATVSGGESIQLRFNGDTGNNYSGTHLGGNGTNAYTGRRSNYSSIITDTAYPTTADNFNQINHIMNYANTTTYKTALIRANNASQYLGATVGMWRNTNAITQIDLTIVGGLQFKSGSTFTLYGILKA